MYKAEILADSLSPTGNRLTTFKVTYPRIVHAEMCRHRMHSRNTASSRAIPFKKMVKDVEENPFIPIAFQKPHSGMQGNEYYDHTLKEEIGGLDYTNLPRRWLRARDTAVSMAKIMADELLNMPVTKQLCNRLLEPFVWVTEIISGTEWENFFDLRLPSYTYKREIFRSKKDCINSYTHGVGKGFKEDRDYLKSLTGLDWLQINQSQADIHIQAIAELMWDARNNSIPKKLKSGEWHIPFGDNIDLSHSSFDSFKHLDRSLTDEEINQLRLKIAVARCARISYETLGNNPKIDYEADIRLYDRLYESGHWSPFEHIARVMSENEYNLSFTHKIGDREESGWCKNFRGFIHYRSLDEKDLWKWLSVG